MQQFLLKLLVLLLHFTSSASSNSSYTHALLKDFGEKTLPKIRYLHFPRTGFAFSMVVVRYACDEQLKDVFKLKDKTWMSNQKCQKRIMSCQDFYKPTPLQYEDAQYTVAMFRNPVQRLASQLRWMRAMSRFVVVYGVADSDVAPLLSMLNSVPSARSVNTSNPCYFATRNKDTLRACRYLLASHFPGLRGCMTKMILGRQCSERYQLTNADLEEAKRLVRSELAFVGIAEKWQESVRLFHSLHGGQLYSDEMFVKAKESPPAIEKVRSALRNSYDYFDEELYVTALETYEKQKLKLEEVVRLTGKDLY